MNLHYGFFYNPLKSVEVYLPWNDTWMDLPNLPTWTVEDGTAYQATLTHIMSLATTGDTNKLHLIGGACMDWNTQAEGIVGTVWRQAFNSRNETFFWEQRFDPETGKCGVYSSHLIIITFVRSVYEWLILYSSRRSRYILCLLLLLNVGLL